MDTLPKPGIRDRKRRETRVRLEEAAVTLVLRDGLDQTTVNAISVLADVSPRTFFNYFDNKESAILGLRILGGDDDPISEFQVDAESADLPTTVVGLLFAVMGAPISRPSIREDRMEIIRRHPQILAGQLAQMTQLSGRLNDAVQGLLARHPRFVDLPASEQAARAELILGICGSAVRVAVKEWAHDKRDSGHTEELEQRAIELVRDTVEKLA